MASPRAARAIQAAGIARHLPSSSTTSNDCIRLLVRLRVAGQFIEWTRLGAFRVDDLELKRTHGVHLLEIPTTLLTQRSKPYIPLEPRLGPPSASPSLVRLVAEARQAQDLIFTHRDRSLLEISKLSRFRPATFARLVRLNYLAPDNIAAILDGTQPASLTRKGLLRFDLPTDWRLQRILLGFEEKPDLPQPADASPISRQAVAVT